MVIAVRPSPGGGCSRVERTPIGGPAGHAGERQRRERHADGVSVILQRAIARARRANALNRIIPM